MMNVTSKISRRTLYLMVCLVMLAMGSTHSAAPGHAQAPSEPVVVYQLVADSDVLGLGIGDAAMSGDGKRLIYTGLGRDKADTVMYMLDTDGSGLTPVSLPPEALEHPLSGDLVINRDGSRAFFTHRGEVMFKVENGVATEIFDAADHAGIAGVDSIRTTADGQYVYFINEATTARQIWRVKHSGGQPEEVVNDQDVQTTQGKGSIIADLAVSADGSHVAFRLQGYLTDTGFKGKQELFVQGPSGVRQLTDDAGNVWKINLAISGDGGTIVYATASSPKKWYSIKSDGSGKTELGDKWGNTARPALTFDGSTMFHYDDRIQGGSLVATDGSSWQDVVARDHPILLSPGTLSISDDGRRVSFIQLRGTPQKSKLYVGTFGDANAVAGAPRIESITFDPPVLPNSAESTITVTARISDPQGLSDITSVQVNELVDGMLEPTNSTDKVPFRVGFTGASRDDGQYQDQNAADGVFTALGTVNRTVAEFEEVVVRIAAQDKAGNVTIMDATLSVGGSLPGRPPPTTTSDYTLRASPSRVAPGSTITVTWTAPAGRPGTDWIGLYQVGAANRPFNPGWWYAEGTASGSRQFTAPVEGGQYEFRYLLEDGYSDVTRSNVVVVAVDAGTTPPPPAQQGDCTFDGVWDTSFGQMTLLQSGTSVTGTYTHDSGRITGTVRGNLLVGKWSEAPSYSEPNDAGDIEYELSADCKSFSGKWKYGSTGSWGGWDGTFVKEREVPPPPTTIPPTAIPPTTTQPPARPLNCNFDRVWVTSFGQMTLEQSGTSVTGTYTHDGGRITGTVRGNLLVGKWSEAPSYSAPNDAGDIEFELSADCNSFDGKWKYGSAGSWSDWTGTFVKGQEGPPPPAIPPPAVIPLAAVSGLILLAESRTVPPGGTRRVPIMLERADGVGSMNFTLTYDPAIGEVVKVDRGGLMSGVLFQANSDVSGVIKFGFATNSGVNKNGSIAVVEFKAVGRRGSSTTLTLSDTQAEDTAGLPIRVGIESGRLVIGLPASGDGNGDGEITELDALMALQMSIGLRKEDLVLDVNGDGRVTAADARILLKEAVSGGGSTAGRGNGADLLTVADIAPELAGFGDLARIRSQPVSATFGTDGGTLNLDDGARILVPPGAFSAPTLLKVAIVDVGLSYLSADVQSSRSYVLESDRDIPALALPLILELPAPIDTVLASGLAGAQWQPVEVSSEPTTRIEITHLSRQHFLILSLALEAISQLRGFNPERLADERAERDRIDNSDQWTRAFYGAGEEATRSHQEICEEFKPVLERFDFQLEKDFPPEMSQLGEQWNLLWFLFNAQSAAEGPRPGYDFYLEVNTRQVIEKLADYDPTQNKGKLLSPAQVLEIAIEANDGNVPKGILAAHNALKDVAYFGRRDYGEPGLKWFAYEGRRFFEVRALETWPEARARLQGEGKPGGKVNEKWGMVASHLEPWRATPHSPSGRYDKMGPLYHIFAAMAARTWGWNRDIGDVRINLGYVAINGEAMLRTIRANTDTPDGEKAAADLCGYDWGDAILLGNPRQAGEPITCGAVGGLQRPLLCPVPWEEFIQLWPPKSYAVYEASTRLSALGLFVDDVATVRDRKTCTLGGGGLCTDTSPTLSDPDGELKKVLGPFPTSKEAEQAFCDNIVTGSNYVVRGFEKATMDFDGQDHYIFNGPSC